MKTILSYQDFKEESKDFKIEENREMDQIGEQKVLVMLEVTLRCMGL